MLVWGWSGSVDTASRELQRMKWFQVRVLGSWRELSNDGGYF